MCEALPGPRCSNHPKEKVDKNRKSMEKTRKEIAVLSQKIEQSYASYDLEKVQDLLADKKAKEEKLQELEEYGAEALHDYYTSPKGLAELKAAESKEKNAKIRANIGRLHDQCADLRERQRCSRKLYVRNKSANEAIVTQRLSEMKSCQESYIKSYKDGSSESALRSKERMYRIARDRVLLAEAGDYKPIGLKTQNVGDVMKKKLDVKGYYVRLNKENLVDDYPTYFPNGNPIDKVTAIEKNGNGYLVVTKSGQKVRSGELLQPLFRS